MIINHARRWVIITPPKTGSTTLRTLLVDESAGRDTCCFTGHQHDATLPRDCQSYGVFATVRNPYDRAVSLWWHRLWDIRHEQGTVGAGCSGPSVAALACEHPFSEFVGWMATAEAFFAWPCTRWLRFVPAYRVLRLESLGADLRRWRLLPTGRPIPHENRTGHGPVHAYYTPEIRDVIRASHRDDFEAFGYSDELPRP